MDGRSHDQIMLSGVLLLNLPAFMSVRHHVLGRASRVLANVCTILLCLLDLRLFICLFVQHERR